MAKIPDRAENQRRFLTLELADRRAIIRAVNRGQVMESRKLASIAVGVARRQQRFWKRAWLLGPVVGLAQTLFPDVTLMAAAANTVVGTALLALVSWFWHRRARQSEELNLVQAGARRDVDQDPRTARSQGAGDTKGASSTTVAGRWRSFGRKRGATPSSDSDDATPRPRGHLPGRGGDEASAAYADDALMDDDDRGARSTPPTQRPYRPRGRKRR